MALQESRRIAIEVEDQAEDSLLLKGFTLTEEVGRPFVCEVELYSENQELDFDAIIGRRASIRLEQGDDNTRYINGFIARFQQGGGQGPESVHRYGATIVPWLWFLTRSADCRIFQDMTIPDILTMVFGDFGFSESVDDKTTGTYEVREYVVQYRETAFNFVSRLMEQEGIYYYFIHDDGHHKMVLADAPSAHEPAPGCEELACRRDGEADKRGVSEWTVEKRVVPGKHVVTDFDFKVPDKVLLSEKEGERSHAASGYEVFDYPGQFVEKAESETQAATRIEELGLCHEIVTARTDARGLSVGCKFKLVGSPRADQDREYVIISMQCTVREESYDTGEEVSEEEFFAATFKAVPAEVQVRSERATLKPLVNGPQTAIVVGGDADEILTDEFGRVKVHFHWDRHNPADATASCWIRVAQVWAGKSWGAMYIPRVGQEVIVEFLEGDPDRPIITGRVYNGECMPPYALPDNKTMSTLKSCSSKGGEGFNELRFEDKKGEEQVFMHGEKDLHVRIKNDSVEWIGNDRHLLVVNDQIEHVQHNREEIVDNDHKELIKNDRNVKVEGKEAMNVVGSLSLTVDDDVIEVFKANQSTEVTGDLYIKADNICIEGGTNITIKVGGTTIAIDSSGISIKAGEFKVETDTTEVKSTGAMDFKADGALTAKSSAAATVQGATADVKADGAGSFKASGALTLKGATTAIN